MDQGFSAVTALRYEAVMQIITMMVRMNLVIVMIVRYLSSSKNGFSISGCNPFVFTLAVIVLNSNISEITCCASCRRYCLLLEWTAKKILTITEVPTTQNNTSDVVIIPVSVSDLQFLSKSSVRVAVYEILENPVLKTRVSIFIPSDGRISSSLFVVATKRLNRLSNWS